MDFLCSLSHLFKLLSEHSVCFSVPIFRVFSKYPSLAHMSFLIKIDWSTLL